MRSSISLSRALGLALVVGSASLAFASSQAPMPQVPSDDTLKDRIEYRLDTSPITDPYNLKVRVDAASVRLTGTVTSGAGRDRAGALAKRTGGVHRVVNQLTIAS